jgi:hypothetical protein
MRERAEQILRIICAGLGLLLAVQLAKLAIHANPLAGVAIPELPSLPAETNEVATITTRPPLKPDTHNVPKTNDLKTNASLTADTNTFSRSKSKVTSTTNSPSVPVAAASMPPATNIPPTNTIASASTKNLPANAIASISTNTSAATNKLEAGTNALSAADSGYTNGASVPAKKRQNKGDMPPGIMAGRLGGKGSKL